MLLSPLFLVLFVCVLFGAGVKNFTNHADTQLSDILGTGVSTGASGLESFLSFMSDAAYEKLEEEVHKIFIPEKK